MLPRDAPIHTVDDYGREWGARRSPAVGARPQAPLPTSARTHNPTSLRQPRGRLSLATQVRTFLCGCGLLYVTLLWSTGLWTSASQRSVASTVRIAPPATPAPSSANIVLQRSAHTASTSIQEPEPWPSTMPPPDPTPLGTISTPDTPTYLSSAPSTTASATPHSSTSSPTASTMASPTAPPSSVPSYTPFPQQITLEWLRNLISKAPPSTVVVPTRSSHFLTLGEHKSIMAALDQKRAVALARVNILQMQLHKVREELKLHAAIVADEEAKLVVDLPREYPKQSTARTFRCIGWRATADCDPNGKRTPDGDRSCLQHVQPRASGYCEVEDTHTKERFRVMKTSCDTLRHDASLRCFDAWHFPNFAIQSLQVLRNASRSEPPTSAPARVETRGIVLVVYPKLLPSAFATLRQLRSLNCTLPIELWYVTSELKEPTSHPIVHALVENYGPITLRAIDDETVTGFTTKIHAIRHSHFDHVLFLDADNVPVKDPTYLFDLPQYRTHGALFWPDFWHPNHTIFTLHPRSLVWEYLDLDFIDMFEQESGQLVIDKTRSSRAFAMLELYAFHRPNLLDKFKIVHGDKDLFRFAWLKSNTSFYMVDRAPAVAGNLLEGMFCGQTMVQFDPQGDVLFLHRNARKLQGRHIVTRSKKDNVESHEDHQLPIAEDEEKSEEPDPEIWTHLLQLKPTSSRSDYTIEIYEGSKAFPKGQWCYGKPMPSAPHFNTFRFEDMPFRDVEKKIIQYASEASELVRTAKSAPQELIEK